MQPPAGHALARRCPTPQHSTPGHAGSTASAPQSPPANPPAPCLQVLPKMAKSQRCGQCDTCLNPQKKKACLVGRAQMVEDLSRKGDLPLSLLPEAGKQPGQKQGPCKPPASSSQPPAKRAKAGPGAEAPGSPTARLGRPVESNGPPRPQVLVQQGGSRMSLGQALAVLTDGPYDGLMFEQQLEGLVGEDGGVSPQNVGRLAQVMRSAPRDQWQLLLLVLKLTSNVPEAAQALVHGPALPIMQAWLQEAAGDLSSSSNRNVAAKALTVAPHAVPVPCL